MQTPILAGAAMALAAFTLQPLAAQTTATVPTICSNLPGNAALSMPLRWTHGTLQVFVDAVLLPASLSGQTITGLRLRRSTLLGDTADPAITRTLTVRGGFQPALAAQMIGGLTANRPANVQVLFGPAAVPTNALSAPSPASAVGPDLLRIVFTTPLPVATGTLFLEFTCGDSPLQILTTHWVDGVWFSGGADTGYAVTVGTGACTTRPDSTWLRWTNATGPTAGSTGSMQLVGAPPSGIALAWAGLDPQAVGFGTSLAAIDPGLVGCYQWTPLQVSWFGVADASGRFTTSLAVPAAAALGTRLGVQAAWFDASRVGVPLSFSNGLVLVVGSAGVGNHCSSMFFPGTSTASPWPAFVGQMPVLMLEH